MSKYYFIVVLTLFFSACIKDRTDKCFCDKVITTQSNDSIISLCYKKENVYKVLYIGNIKEITKHNINNPSACYDYIFIESNKINASKSSYIKVKRINTDSIEFSFIGHVVDSVNVDFINENNDVILSLNFKHSTCVFPKDILEKFSDTKIIFDIFYVKKDILSMSKFIPELKERMKKDDTPIVTSSTIYPYKFTSIDSLYDIEGVLEEISKCK